MVRSMGLLVASSVSRFLQNRFLERKRSTGITRYFMPYLNYFAESALRLTRLIVYGKLS